MERTPSQRMASHALKLSHYHQGRTAQELVDSLLDGAVVKAANNEPVEHIGRQRIRADRFTLSAGGPGHDVTFLFVEGDVEMAIVDYFEPDNVRAQRVLHGQDAAILHGALAAYGPKQEGKQS